MDIVYFDLETQRTANDAGGWDKKAAMGMTVGATYSTGAGRYAVFGEERVHELVDHLQQADLVVGFNLINFDYEVLMGYTVMDLAHSVPTLDLMVDLEKGSDTASGWRPWRQGRKLEVARYCCFDVKVTRLVHEHGMAHGEVFFTDRLGRKQRVAVDWGVPARERAAA